jgi:hypothetical protein
MVLDIPADAQLQSGRAFYLDSAVEGILQLPFLV